VGAVPTRTETSDQALQVDAVTKAFGQRVAVDDVSFAVRPGEVFGFLGPNGSGKTTTIRMALGILRPDGGSVSVLGASPSLSVLREVGWAASAKPGVRHHPLPRSPQGTVPR
jgi:ABC-type multidrug transport system ATPase subunit